VTASRLPKVLANPALFLFLLSPAIGELLSGSSPPAEFFTPFGLTMLLGLYGSGALLARELKVRWGKGMGSLLLLGAAYGALEEGVMVASWFNPAWPDLGILGVFGRWLEVNWVWAAELTMYHAIVSVTVPVMLVELAFPDRRGQPWVSDRWLKAIAAILLLDVAVGFVLFGLLLGYTPPLPQFLLAPAVVIMLALLAKRLPAEWARRGTKPMRRPRFYATVAVVGAVASALTFLVVPNLQPPPALVIAIGVAIIYGLIRLLTRYNWREATDLHRLAIAVGSIAIFVAFAFFQELDKSRVDNTSGMMLVGFASLVGLAYLGLRVRARTRPADHRNKSAARDHPMIPAVIASIRQATPTIKTLRLEPRDAFSFKAGQWLDCYADIGGERRVAGYSMTSSPLDGGRVDLAVKDVGENPVTRYIHGSAKEGDTLYLDGGNGEVFYEAGTARDVCLISGGIGIAPHMSIFRYIDEGDPNARCTLLYSAGTPDELLFREEIDAITQRNPRMRRFYTVTDESPGWGGKTGKVDAEMIREAGLPPEALYYICGPPAMIHGLVDTLRGLGVRRKQMRYELWW
jgi:ferredoxin-NADP reductase